MRKYNVLAKISLAFFLMTFFCSEISAQSVIASGYTFSTASKSYSYLSGGTPVTAVEVDDAYTTIPIGFTFKFCGVNYTDVTVCSNGWLRFGTGAGSSSANWNYNATPNSGIEPAVYVLYEDVSGVGGTSTYITTGAAPNRIFKWECKNWLWDYGATTPCVSFQVWLHEATGVVECLYKTENATAVSLGSSGGATIGIGRNSTDWQVLDGVGASPNSSSSTYTANLSATPATGQSYMWDPGAPCPLPTAITVNLVNSMYVDFSWTAAGASVGYEYVVDQNSGNPTTAPVTTVTTTGSASGLTPNSQYYIHVRNKCGASNYSSWVTLPFNTLPACEIPPPGIQVPYVDSNSATVTWGTVGTSVHYEYVVKTDNSTPGPGTTINTTTSNLINLTSLVSGKTYYIYLRVKCVGNDSSSWIMDSVYVPIPCRAPDMHVNNLNSGRVVIFWDAPLTAYEYEIINSSSVIANPVSGIPIPTTSRLFTSLDEATVYHVYAKSYCDDKGVKTMSDWGHLEYTTWGLDISEVPGVANEMQIAPNPVGNDMVVSVKEVTGSGKISITDLAGKLLKVVDISNTRTILDVSELTPGLYLIRYADRQGSVQSKFNKL